jgi:hypothetical protein
LGSAAGKYLFSCPTARANSLKTWNNVVNLKIGKIIILGKTHFIIVEGHPAAFHTLWACILYVFPPLSWVLGSRILAVIEHVLTLLLTKFNAA